MSRFFRGISNRFLGAANAHFEKIQPRDQKSEECDRRHTDHKNEAWLRMEVLIDDVPVIYDEVTNRWEVALTGVVYSEKSLSAARQRIMSTPVELRRVYAGPQTALLRHELDSLPAGTRMQVVSEERWIAHDGEPFSQYRVRHAGSAIVRLGAHQLVADTPENAAFFEDLAETKDLAKRAQDRLYGEFRNAHPRPFVSDESDRSSGDT